MSEKKTNSITLIKLDKKLLLIFFAYYITAVTLSINNKFIDKVR